MHISFAFFFIFFLFPLGVLHFLEPGEGRWEDRDGEQRGLLSRAQSRGFWDGVRLGLCITQHNTEFQVGIEGKEIGLSKYISVCVCVTAVKGIVHLFQNHMTFCRTKKTYIYIFKNVQAALYHKMKTYFDQGLQKKPYDSFAYLNLSGHVWFENVQDFQSIMT